MPRPLEFDKDKALVKAMNVFWRKGYEATSLQDLLKAMSLSKSSFYQSFTSKEELFKSCLSHYRNSLARELIMGLDKAPSAYAFLQQYFREIADDPHRERLKGCMLMNTATEFSQSNPAVAMLVRDGVAHLETLLTSVVKQAQKEGDIPANKDPQILANFLTTNISGLKTLAKAGTDESMLKAIADTLLEALKKA